MGVFKRADSRNWWINYSVAGKQIVESARTRDRAEAEAIYARRSRQFSTVKEISRGAVPGVYVVRSALSGLVKIGCSGNIDSRLRHIQNLSPERLEVIALIPTDDYRMAESFLHFRFKDKRLHGEWFEIDWVDIWHAIEEFFRREEVQP